MEIPEGRRAEVCSEDDDDDLDISTEGRMPSISKLRLSSSACFVYGFIRTASSSLGSIVYAGIDLMLRPLSSVVTL